MLLSNKIRDMLIDKLGGEIRNAIHYKNMRAYFEKLNLNGFAKYFDTQADGEFQHAKIIENYLAEKQADYNIPVIMNIIEIFSSPINVMDTYLSVEIGTTKELYAIYKAALDEDDYGTIAWLTANTPGNDLPLVPEQLEEEQSAYDLQAEVARITGQDNQINGVGLNGIDRRLLE